MPTDGIVRVSWQHRRNGPPGAYQAAYTAGNQALVGEPRARSGAGPFKRVNSAAYICTNANDDAVQLALKDLARATRRHVLVLDYVSITITRRPHVIRLRKKKRSASTA